VTAISNPTTTGAEIIVNRNTTLLVSTPMWDTSSAVSWAFRRLIVQSNSPPLIAKNSFLVGISYNTPMK